MEERQLGLVCQRGGVMAARQLGLKQYQVDAAYWLITQKSANLWADMGMGKTIIMLFALELLGRRGHVGPMPKSGEPRNGFSRALVVTKKRLAEITWPEECDPSKWSFLKNVRVTAIRGNPEQRAKLLEESVGRNQIHTISFESIAWLVDYYTSPGSVGRGGWPYTIVIIDESTRLKSLRMIGGGKQVKALMRIAPLTNRWYNLTGTPAPNSYEALWGQQWFIDYQRNKKLKKSEYVYRLGRTYTEFKTRFFKCHPVLGFPQELLPGKDKEIGALLAPTTYRISAKDHIDIEEPVIEVLNCYLPDGVKKMHDKLASNRDIVTLPSGSVIAPPNNAVGLAKANQVCAGSIYKDRSQYDTQPGEYENLHTKKLDLLDEYLEEVQGSNVLVAYSNRFDRERILTSPLAAKYGIRDINDSSRTIEEWNRGLIPVMLLHPASAGHGLSLQFGGHHLVFYSLDHNAETHFQTIERIGPMRQLQSGYDRAVFVTYLIARGTVEEVIYKALRDKRDCQEALKEYARNL